MLKIPTMDDWFALVRRYPEYKTVGVTLLKDYGVMACMSFIEDTAAPRGKDFRILEFGHGFNPAIMAKFQDKHEVWGADRDIGLHYFKGLDWDSMFASKVAAKCPNVRFVRELLGNAVPSGIPDDYFDCMASVSVLEEVSIPILQQIIRAAFRKLRSGGLLIGTHDLLFNNAERRVSALVDAHRSAGFTLQASAPYLAKVSLRNVLLEHPAAVMIWYQMEVPEEQRRYNGHWGTVFSVAQKP